MKPFIFGFGMLISLGVTAVYAFLVHASWKAWIWALVSVFVALWTTILHVFLVTCHPRGKILLLKGSMICAYLVQVVAVSGIVMMLTLALDGNEEFGFSSVNFWPGVGGCGMTLSWGYTLFFYSRSLANACSRWEASQSGDREFLLPAPENQGAGLESPVGDAFVAVPT